MQDTTEPASVDPARAPLIFDGLRISRSRDVLTRVFRRGALGAYFATVVLSLVQWLLRALHFTPPRPLLLFLGLLSYTTLGFLVAALLAATRRLRRHWVAGITARSGALALQQGSEREELKLADLTSGLLLHPSPDRYEVELSPRGGDGLRIEVPDARAGRDLLDALGLGPDRRTVEVELDAPNRSLHVGLRTWLLVFLLGMPVAIGFSLWSRSGTSPSQWFMPLMMVLGIMLNIVPALAMGWWWPQRVTVGADGVLWSRRGHRRFIRYTEISEVKRTDTHLTLALRDGSTVTLRATGSEATSVAWALENRLLATIERIAAHASETGYDVLDPPDTNVRTWLRAIESRARPSQAFRDMGFEPDRLRALLDNPTTTGAKRVGAAVALSGSGEADAGRRIRIAARATASPRLRDVLETIADGQHDEAAIEELLVEEQMLRQSPRSVT